MMEYTIVRQRIVTQVQTDYVQADSDEEALKIANQGQCEENGANDLNEWHDLKVEYPKITSISILEAVGE